MDNSDSSRVKVFVRARPALANEQGCAPCFEVDSDTNSVRLRADDEALVPSSEDSRSVGFDGAFSGDATQQEVFTKVGLPVLRECLRGLNGTILAYGQTGSGKTHSLLHQGRSVEEAGLLPRLVATLFMQVAQDPGSVYDIDAAAMQVYNEQVDDLLHPHHQYGLGLGLPVQNGGIVPGLTRLKCDSPAVLLEAFGRARSNLIYAETRMNKASSRSHAVFQICITRRERLSKEEAAKECMSRKIACTHARLSVVDLAGSERVKKSGAEGVQLREATAINRSLLAFGNVVSALAAKRPHVPFRDSKLTRILEGSIGGNSKTALLVCVNPLPEHSAETLSALELAARALRVEVDARVNESVVEVSSKVLQRDLDSLSALACAQEFAALRAAKDEAEERCEEERKEQELAKERYLRARQQAATEARRADEAERELAVVQDRYAREWKERERIEEEALQSRQVIVCEKERADVAELALADLEAECKQLREELQVSKAEQRRWQTRAELSEQRVEESRMAAEDAQARIAKVSEAAVESAEELERALKERDEAIEKAALVEEEKERELEELAAEVEASAVRETELQQETEETLRQWQDRALEAMRRAESLQAEVARSIRARTVRIRAQPQQGQRTTRRSTATCRAASTERVPKMVEVR